MEFFKVLDQLTGTLKRVLEAQEGGNQRSHAFAVFGEYSLENSKVKLRHFEHNFVKNFRNALVSIVFSGIKYWWLK